MWWYYLSLFTDYVTVHVLPHDKSKTITPNITKFSTCDYVEAPNLGLFFARVTHSIVRICYGNMAGWVTVTRQYCIKTAKPTLKHFRPHDSPNVLVSSDPCTDTQFQGEPLQRGR